MIADLMKNEIEQIEEILMKMIEMLKVDLKENVENSSKLVRTLNRIENRSQIIEKQNVNQSIKAKTYASVVKATTKIKKIENENKNAMKKMTTTNMTTTKKKIDDENRKWSRKKRIAKHNKCWTFEKNQKSHRKEQKRDDEIKMTFQWKFDAIFSIFENQEKTEKLHDHIWLNIQKSAA